MVRPQEWQHFSWQFCEPPSTFYLAIIIILIAIRLFSLFVLKEYREDFPDFNLWLFEKYYKTDSVVAGECDFNFNSYCFELIIGFDSTAGSSNRYWSSYIRKLEVVGFLIRRLPGIVGRLPLAIYIYAVHPKVTKFDPQAKISLYALGFEVSAGNFILPLGIYYELTGGRAHGKEESFILRLIWEEMWIVFPRFLLLLITRSSPILAAKVGSVNASFLPRVLTKGGNIYPCYPGFQNVLLHRRLLHYSIGE